MPVYGSVNHAQAVTVNIVVLGSSSAFTSIVVQGLIAASANLRALLLLGRKEVPSGRGRQIPVAKPGAIEIVAAANRIDTFEIETTRDEHTRSLVEDLEPDVLLIACFGEILPAQWLALPRHVCINLHPSALPAYRGPSPLFWQLRAGEPRMGVTVHRAIDRVDAGPILAQQLVDAPAGAAASEILVSLLEVGAELVVDTLARLGVETGGRTQDETQASYFGWPKQSDFGLSTEWTAERAFRFIRGTREWGHPYTVEVDGKTVVIDRALDFDPEGRLESAAACKGREVSLQFARGTLRGVRVKE